MTRISSFSSVVWTTRNFAWRCSMMTVGEVSVRLSVDEDDCMGRIISAVP